MADYWLEAATALEIFGNRMSICERCHAGLIRAQAASFHRVDDVQANAELPREFWWAEGHEALDQNWQTGDFSTWIDHKHHWRAFGVRFALDDLLKLLPVDQHGSIRRRLSVAGNPAWVSAREARRFAYENGRVNPMTAGNAVVEQCRLGFVMARAVEMRWALGRYPNDGWTEEGREWDVPIWFWDTFTTKNASSQDWEQGRFAGRGRAPQGYGWVTLNGVHFLRSSLDVLLPSAPPAQGGDDQAYRRKPALSEADLRRWWEKLAPVREGLTQEQLRALAVTCSPFLLQS